MLDLRLSYLLLLRNEDAGHGDSLLLEVTELILKALELLKDIRVFFLLGFHHGLNIDLDMFDLFLVYLQSLSEPVYIRELVTSLEHSSLQLCYLFNHSSGVVKVEADLGHNRDLALTLPNKRVHMSQEHGRHGTQLDSLVQGSKLQSHESITMIAPKSDEWLILSRTRRGLQDGLEFLIDNVFIEISKVADSVKSFNDFRQIILKCKHLKYGLVFL